MWELESTDAFDRRYKQYEKKHRRELAAVLVNLQKVHDALNMGGHPNRLPGGFIHPEQKGVIALDQKGGGSNLAETRLYIFLDSKTRTIHLLTLGDKRTQPADVKLAADFATEITRREGQDDHADDSVQEPAGDDQGPER